MRKNRDRLSIVVAILKASDSSLSKTRIMFAANLSFKLLEKYLDLVIGAGFLRVDGSTYLLTTQGREFLERHKDFHQRYAKAQRMLEILSCERDDLSRLCGKKISLATC
jgi:predicted transcriptional regulator